MAIWKPTIIKNVNVKYIIWLMPIALILKCIILCLERSPSDSKSTLLQVMAWCHQLTSHYLKECSAMHDLQWHMKGLVQDCSNSIALAMELLQSCAKPSIWCNLAIMNNKSMFSHPCCLQTSLYDTLMKILVHIFVTPLFHQIVLYTWSNWFVN